MFLRKIAAVSTLAIAATVLTVGPAGADPHTPAAVNYTATTSPSNTVISIDSGSLSTEGGIFAIKAEDGTVLAGTPLQFRVDDFLFPIAAEINDKTATLTPRFDLEHAVYQPVALPFEDQASWKTPYDREVAAFTRLKDTIATGASIGTMVGGIGGGVVGCILGGIAGATVAAATIVGMFGPFIPAAAVGCLGGIIAIGALGTLAGQLLVTAPVAIAALAQYFTTINQPFTPRTK
ncbi:hypothetical protein [Nocardia cyriacigeorgica]|uniref:hypothetical protein n=1 Tax=Nocardia cyriacigeorgica TaxID=135487 RepID=UPI00189378F2|nr:hypothetical protein [Nocardia cyriacigeorgica]MBF6453608.1 hypothetical protein [Nocardia cyriacigeorgica]MBF6480805.1 hypothetical protein [Nocardia cyriacigeorgica]MBF6550776.1 hypothetical protein [Nocardia cyriacigeorgica]